MNTLARRFGFGWTLARRATWADAIVLAGLAALVYAGAELAMEAPEAVSGPTISLAPSALPLYAALSAARMLAAYMLSLAFTMVYGYVAARNRRAEQVMIPLLDVLQSVPILSFLPVVLLSLSAIVSQNIAAEIASVVLIFTGQVWNLTFAWYQSLVTIPRDLQEASDVFRLNGWLRLKFLELPYAAISLIWNSMMSWAGGWFFLMAAEMFTVGDRDFRLPGLGTYLQTAANAGDLHAILRGVGTLIIVIVAIDQLLWRPLLVWAERFKVETVSADFPPSSWLYDVLHRSALAGWFARCVLRPAGEFLDSCFLRLFSTPRPRNGAGHAGWTFTVLLIFCGGAVGYGVYRAAGMLAGVSGSQWLAIALGLLATFARVTVALLIALAWTVPLGVALGTNRKLAAWLQPVAQIAASVPATALFPVLLLLVLGLPGGLDVAAVLLMLMGTQWYLLFNVIAGASAIPQDLKYTSALLGLGRWEKWRVLILPALFPYLVTGAITASGGAWNASVVAEYASFGGKTVYTVGIGALIARATASGDFPLLLASTLSMIFVVVLINRIFWRKLYRRSAAVYRLE